HDDDRLSLELELLQAMYPGQIDFDPRSRDFRFSEKPSLLHLRIPEHYPNSGSPDVLSASDSSHNDLRNRLKTEIQKLDLSEGTEALDAIVACFQTLILSTDHSNLELTQNHANPPTSESCKTVIIWLHHLLATSKRKLAISPPGRVNGVTKPGYPGVMIFSGPASAVDEHVRTLKAENWQAFQVRYEEAVSWDFLHKGVKEVETLGEVTKAVEAGESGTKRKDEFLKAVGI
ncbi:hypothetical protein M011DRAFT_392346, partial [Sporormia fimetaria CBS 119925]